SPTTRRAICGRVGYAAAVQSKPSVKQYWEEAPPTDFEAFATVVESRRSVRRFADEPIPDEVVERCLDLALLAPTSSNLQCWELYRVVDPAKKQALVEACLSQPAAATAAELIVAVARIDTWKRNARDILRHLERDVWTWPKSMHAYYSLITRIAYDNGPLGLLGPVKKALVSAVGLVRPIPRGPTSRAELVTWAVKTTALACENLMLAFRAAGYDSCPMEGMDEERVRRILGLGRDAIVTMVIGAGRRRRGGVYGPRIRLPRERFVKTV
ncbi:MAG TPA: nitroreductase family protein, partial [Polyangiaceae bacterium LLY-WYZ-15_(1-7)]|nr:nitroreductase family protein [Polyangiaceae bacterium LLY-WYZ-15_(1-7)]